MSILRALPASSILPPTPMSPPLLPLLTSTLSWHGSLSHVFKQTQVRPSHTLQCSKPFSSPKYSSTSGLSPRGHLERQAEFHASTQDEA